MPKATHLKPWVVLDQQTALSTPWFTIHQYSCELPNHKIISPYYVSETPDAVLCVAVTETGEVIVEKQWRLPLKKVSLDFPAGAVDAKDPSAESAVIRELEEETGYRAAKVTLLKTLDKDPGFSQSKVHIFLATDVKKVSNPQQDTELIELELWQPAQVLQAVASNELSCAFCTAATFLAAKKLGW